MEVHSHAEILVDAAIEPVFDYATDPARIPSLFVGWGPIPAIVRMEVLGDGIQRTGAKRSIHNSDGTTLDEVLLAFERPHTQAYRLSGAFRGLSALLLKEGSGRWTFSRVDGESTPRTRVCWDYTFVLRTPLALPIAIPLAKIAFRRAQEVCLANLRNAFAAGEPA